MQNLFSYKWILFAFWILYLPGQVIFSQDHKTKDDYTGAWETPSSWDPSWPSPRLNVNNLDITINGYITAHNSLRFYGSSSKLIIDDTLVIIGNLTIDDNNDVQVNNNGILIVRGDLTISERSKIEAKNYIIVTGNIIKLGSTNDGEFSSDDDPVKVFIGGSVSPTSLTINKTNFDALNCSSPPTTPYTHSGCSYGNLTDIMSDPIYPFFQSTCTTPTLSSSDADNIFCTGTSVIFTAGGGTNYDFRVNGTSVQNGGSSTYTTTALTNGAIVDVMVTGTCNSTSSGITNTVFELPEPAIAGPAAMCVDAPENVYTTSPGMSDYLWTVSSGGTITAGGGTSNNTVTVTWTTTGAKTVTVNYTNGYGCTASSPASYNVTVNPLPTPTIAGPTEVCIGGSGNVYTTSAGMSDYLWTVSSGGTITAGGGTSNNTVTVTWATTGAKTVIVTYTNSNGCAAISPASHNVTVNPLPAPIITGPTEVCVGEMGNLYTTSGGMSDYLWTVSAGGIITAGGGTSNNTATVTWATTGVKTVTLNYTNGNGCTASSPANYDVIVNPLPTPTILGPTAVLVGATGNVYTTEAGMSNYLWTVSAGGTITSGGGTTNNTVTVTWETTGEKTIRVNYTNGNGCTATSTVTYNVTVYELATPTIAGPTSVCTGGEGNVYTTEAGMNDYLWTVSSGGTITAGGGTSNNTVTVTWETTGAKTIRVNYTNGNGITAASPTTYNVTVNPLPIPIITGPAAVCVGATGNVYTTEAGMSNYLWTVSAGGNITAGGGTSNNTVTVTWTTSGDKTFTVSYTNSNGCTATSPITYNVTVNPLPSPTIIGPTMVSVGATGNVYTTEAGMSNYLWTVSAGGTITSGGGTANNSVTVTWASIGVRTVRVNYTNGNGCTATSPVTYNVTVNALMTPTIAGPTSICVGGSGNVYTTETGMNNYLWTVSAGGTITAGGGTENNTVTVTWETTGAKTIRVNYTNGNGITAASPTTYNVTVNPLPIPIITGPAAVCVGATVNVYTTEAGMSNYLWTVSAGGTMTAGGGIANNTVTVTWETTGPKTVTVNYTNGNGCSATSPVSYNVTVNPLPTPTIAGPTEVCVGEEENVYTTATGMSDYLWTVSTGGTITAGGGTTNNTITVTWTTTGAKTITVNNTNSNGCTAASPAIYNVTVNPLPTPTISGPTTVIVGAIGNIYTTEAGMSNYLWSVSAGGTITAGGGTANNTVTVTWTTIGTRTVRVNYTNGNGCTAVSSASYNVTVNPLYSPTISGPTSVCVGESGNVYTTEAGMNNYLWNVSAGGTITAGGGATNNTVTVTWETTGAKTVRVNYTNSNGFTAVSPTTQNVSVNPLPIPTITGPAATCAGANGNVYTTEAGMTNYVWTLSAGGTITAGGGTANNTVTMTWATTGAKTITVTYTNGNGCTAASPAAYNVSINTLLVSTAGNNGPLCAGSALSLTGGPSGMAIYSWTGPNGFTSVLQNPAVSNNSTINMAGIYTLTVTNDLGCSSTASTLVTVNDLSEATASSNGPVCVGNPLRLTAGPAAMMTYVWTGPNGFTSSLQNPSVSENAAFSMTGIYTLTATSVGGCRSVATTSVTVNENPIAIAGPDQELTFIFETYMAAEISPQERGEWDLLSGSGQIGSIHSPTTLVTELSTGENLFLWIVQNGSCMASDEVKIIVYDLFVPSVITPNNDGKNDYFMISDNIGKVELIILNQWGNEEYRNSNYLNDWDGRDNSGAELPYDTYFYILKLESGKIKKGSVLIIR